eukprot:TRINITY_DN2900_c0_g1_i1.p1 TRINITY_DN2900_c0_g1~~TRINITY_DN2900_c0_g1_i1.p1  ORF type:complete len:348 (-),score=82.82 TRINITY_DN2900_c0_g1_i1:272-1315(-)
MEAFGDPNGTSASLKGKTLVLPSVSIGNVGQLAIDLLVETLNPPRACFLEEPHVLPCVGNDPFGRAQNGALTTALEVFVDEARSLAFLQQRAPVIAGKLDLFASNLGDWLLSEGVSDVVLVSGADAGKRTPSQMEGEQVRYLASAGGPSTAATSDAAASRELSDPRCEALGWKVLENGSYSTRLAETSEAARESSADPALAGRAEQSSSSSGVAPPVQGYDGEGEGMRRGAGDVDEEWEEGEEDPGPLDGGEWGPERGQRKPSYLRLFQKLESKGVHVLLLLLFCNEGDNVGDALAMADLLDKLLHLIPSPSAQPLSHGRQDLGQRWRIPLSWQHLFGPPPDVTLFG